MPTQIELIKKHRLSIRGHLGQHLLIDPNIQRNIAALLDVKKEDAVLEIGPGLGALTPYVAVAAGSFWAVEKDPKFVAILTEEWKEIWDSAHLLIHRDILDLDFQKDLLPRNKKSKIKVIGNLPYYITAPILIRLMENRDLLDCAVIMIQKEVADRLLAVPGNKDYGRLTLAVRYGADVEHAFDVPPSCFTPRPQVESSVLVLRFRTRSADIRPDEESLFFHLTALAFGKRRKMLLPLLAHDSRIALGRPGLEEIFSDKGILFTVRGEELSLKDYLALARSILAKKA